MALADIQKKIELEAKEKADLLIAEAKKTVAQIEKNAEEELAAVKAKFDAQLAEEEPEIQRRAKIVADLDVRRLMLGAKHQLLNQSYEGGLAHLTAMDQGAYCDFCANLLEQAVNEGNEQLVVGNDEKYLDEHWLDQMNSQKGWKLTFHRLDTKLGGGFLLRRGKVSENCSFPTLVRWIKEDLESELALRLFGSK